MRLPNKITITRFHTPIGEMIAGAMNDGLVLFDFSRRKMLWAILNRLKKGFNAELEEGYHPIFKELKLQVEEFFSGERKEFELPIKLAGTEFQKKVWEELLKIPYGDIRSYKQQAIALGDELAVRAVAKANGENCLAIIVPCHRVISETGSLTGYAGGLMKKKWLLKFEKMNSGQEVQQSFFEE